MLERLLQVSSASGAWSLSLGAIATAGRPRVGPHVAPATPLRGAHQGIHRGALDSFKHTQTEIATKAAKADVLTMVMRRRHSLRT